MTGSRRHKSRRASVRPPANARELAYSVLDEYKRTSQFVASLLDERATAGALAENERRLAREIVSGVIRRQSTLNALIEPQVARPRHQVEGELWTLLQIGTYQLVFMDSIPAHAAVHETVETARSAGKPRWCGLLNGVLRSISRVVTEERVAEPAIDTVPMATGEFRKCVAPIFPDPASNVCGYISRAFSLPEWLVTRWSKRFKFPELCRMGFWFNEPPTLCLRVNTLRTSRDEMLTQLAAAEISARPGELDEAIWIESPTRVESLPGFHEGWFVVQDESAMQAARLLAPQPGQSVLDLCAAPGTKSTHLAALMNDEGSIVAADVHSERLSRIQENVDRLGLRIIQSALIRSDGTDIPPGPFDAVLIDAPCSNTGVLGKRPEARWRLGERDINELAGIQLRLLDLACDRLKPGGRLVYSTCSIEPDENQEIVRAVMGKRNDIELMQDAERVPGVPGDGGYQALLRRTI